MLVILLGFRRHRILIQIEESYVISPGHMSSQINHKIMTKILANYLNSWVQHQCKPLSTTKASVPPPLWPTLTTDIILRPNLKIATGQIVTKIIFDHSGPQPLAVGVEMGASALSPLRYLAKAKKEVLLCAGSIGTPQLLKLSGERFGRSGRESDGPYGIPRHRI